MEETASMFLMLGIHFKDLKVMELILSVRCQLSVSAALCCRLVRAVRSQLEQMSGVRAARQLMAWKPQFLSAACGNN